MLSGTRLRSNRAKRAQKYTNEEAESTLIDAESIRLFVENSPSVLPGGTGQNVNKERFEKHSTSVSEGKKNTMLLEGGQWTINQALGILRDGQPTQDTSNSFMRSPRKVKDPSYLIEDREPCFYPEIMTPAVSISSFDRERDGDLFGTRLAGNSNKRNKSIKKVENRHGNSLIQRSEEWDLCNDENGYVPKFDLNGSVRQSVRIHNDRSRAEAGNRSSSNCAEHLVFSDIFRERIKKTTSCPNEFESGLQSGLNRARKSPRHCRLERNGKGNHSDSVLFTDIRFSDEELPAKNTQREFPWGKDNPGELKLCTKDTLRNKPLGKDAYQDSHAGERPIGGLYPDKNSLRHLSSEECTMDNLYTGKDTSGNKEVEEDPPVEDQLELLEDSKDLVDELNKSGGNEFTDTQGQRSFVCLVDQLTDLRVRQKFDSHFASKRRQAVCEELEKACIWNNKCLYEHRRDLNVRTALTNMFM